MEKVKWSNKNTLILTNFHNCIGYMLGSWSLIVLYIPKNDLGHSKNWFNCKIKGVAMAI